jgi:ribosome recycling factor
MSIENEVKAAMKGAIEHLKQELKSLRTGRANPGLLDTVHVEVYGTKMKLKELATVTVPEPRQLLVTPFDPQNGVHIAKGIEAANLNVRPVHDGGVVRITLPPMDEAMRKEIVKQCKKKGEDAKIVIREIRRKYNEMARKQKADSEITEDVMKKLEKIIQEHTDKSCKEADTVCGDKEKEILTI